MTAISLHCQAQHAITFDDYCLLPGDSLCMETVDYTDAGLPGEGRVWDFSRVSVTGDYKGYYFMDSDSAAILFADHERLCTYHQSEYSLNMLREESHLFFIDYSQSLLVMQYPMRYGERTQQPFFGDGVYCGRIFIRREGTKSIEADGLGTLIRAEGDTLHNVLRTHEVTTATLRQSPDSLASDSGNVLQEMTERFKWFVPGLRHHAYETTSTTYYYNGEPYITNRTACRYMAESSANRTEEDTMRSDQQPSSIFSFSVSDGHGSITIDYTVTEPSRLQVIVADITGMLHLSESFRAEAGSHQHAISCPTLSSGQYILYVNTGGTVYNCKFTHQ